MSPNGSPACSASHHLCERWLSPQPWSQSRIFQGVPAGLREGRTSGLVSGGLCTPQHRGAGPVCRPAWPACPRARAWPVPAGGPSRARPWVVWPVGSLLPSSRLLRAEGHLDPLLSELLGVTPGDQEKFVLCEKRKKKKNLFCFRVLCWVKNPLSVSPEVEVGGVETFLSLPTPHPSFPSFLL